MSAGPPPAIPLSDSAIGIYVHIPFCETKCPYCDFNTYSGIERLVPDYVSALCTEISRWGELLPGVSAGSVFFGGGTPSYLPAEEIERVMATLKWSFPLTADAEVTLEANPGDVTPHKAESWLAAGFNRVSMGVQSFDDGLLRLLGRRHDAETARSSFTALGDAGFDNRSLDLMFGLPGQALDQWTKSMDEALELGLDHVSLYGLQLEPGTPLEADVRLGRTAKPDDDLAADMYRAAEERFEAAGFRHYEISNWAQPGRESRHNLVYWQNGAYLGFGPGAHSSMFGHRFSNTKSPRWYMRYLGIEADDLNGLPVAATSPPDRGDAASSAESAPRSLQQMIENGAVDFVEQTTPQLELAETMMMGLRLDTGVRGDTFRSRFGRSLRDLFAAEIDDLHSLGLLDEDARGIRLTAKGRLLGNEVFGRFVASAESNQ